VSRIFCGSCVAVKSVVVSTSVPIEGIMTGTCLEVSLTLLSHKKPSTFDLNIDRSNSQQSRHTGIVDQKARGLMVRPWHRILARYGTVWVSISSLALSRAVPA